jgi:hypothetical protein
MNIKMKTRKMIIQRDADLKPFMKSFVLRQSSGALRDAGQPAGHLLHC